MRDSTNSSPLTQETQGSADPKTPQGSSGRLIRHGSETGHEAKRGEGAAPRREPVEKSLAPPVHPDPATWTCPACGFSQRSEPEECPHCGVILSKLKAQTQVPLHEQLLSAETVDGSDARKVKTWTTVILGLLVCVTLGLIAIKWFSGGRAAKHEDAQVGSNQTAAQVRKFTLANYQQDVMVESDTRPVLLEFFTHT